MKSAKMLLTQLVLTSCHVPLILLEAVEAQRKIEPVVSGFRDTVGKLHHLAEEVRIRSEQSIYLTRPVGLPVPSDLTSQQVINPPTLGRPPTITRPLSNLFTEERSSIVLETEFDSGLPPGENIAQFTLPSNPFP